MFLNMFIQTKTYYLCPQQLMFECFYILFYTIPLPFLEMQMRQEDLRRQDEMRRREEMMMQERMRQQEMERRLYYFFSAFCFINEVVCHCIIRSSLYTLSLFVIISFLLKRYPVFSVFLYC